MHKISNFTGQARHGWEKMSPSMTFGASRQSSAQDGMLAMASSVKRGTSNSTIISSQILPGQQISLSFNIPFNSNLTGPDPNDVLYSSPGAFQRWTFPGDSVNETPVHTLPVHTRNVQDLRSLCKILCEDGSGRVHYMITSNTPRPIAGMHRGPLTALVTNVCIQGDAEMVHKIRSRILNETPITLRCETLDLDREIVFPQNAGGARADILEHMDEISHKTKADIFLLEAKFRRKESEAANFTDPLEKSMDKRLQLHIFGDTNATENAKTRLLIMVDQLLQRHVDSVRLDLSMHNLISGRNRRNIKLIESATSTAIYFPPPFTTVYGYSAPDSVPLRGRDEIILTGATVENISQAKKRLHDLVTSTKTFVKDVQITTCKIDFILLERLDKVRRIIEANGSHVLLPPLGSHSGVLRVQATDILSVERTVREIMSLSGQFYSASWWIAPCNPMQYRLTAADVREMLPNICIDSGAEITSEKLNFHINGSDDAVKAALSMINSLITAEKAQSTLRVKLELANEHKEFVSGKKNGKINKIMSQSNVQIIFDGFNEYNFYIDVRGTQYEATRNGLDLVELEMPASISFHVPDQYHKRIIGIGGQHIQRIMKKYSVFVKFSNAMDRGGGCGPGLKDDDDVKVDNVICRTPARNADNLELVKQEIMDMVEKVDADFVSERVHVDRLYHRELISRMAKIEELEKKWNCKITFPGTEQASDIIIVSGPEYQVPQAVDEFLGMVPEAHEIEFPSSVELRSFLASADFTINYLRKLCEQYVVDVTIMPPRMATEDGSVPLMTEKLKLNYTRNNAGGVKDAIDFLLVPLITRGLDASTVKGLIPRPKSDSFEDNMLFFESKLLQRAEPALRGDKDSHRTANEVIATRSIFDKLRKPGSMPSFTSFIERRRKTGPSSPNSFFMHHSSNASKASLISMESRESGYRNPWNDSGIELEHSKANSGIGLNSMINTKHGSGWSSFSTSTSRPNTSSNSLSSGFETKFPFGANGNASTGSLNALLIPGLGMQTNVGTAASAIKTNDSFTVPDPTDDHLTQQPRTEDMG